MKGGASTLVRLIVGAAIGATVLWGAWRVSKGEGAPVAPVPAARAAGSLQVDVSGVRSDNGVVIGSMCRQGEAFVAGCSLKAKGQAVPGTVSLHFDGLASGDYALALFHDENNNGRLELEAEGIGFSNNANLAHTAPDFDASRIKVAGATRIRVRLRYPAE